MFHIPLLFNTSLFLTISSAFLTVFLFDSTKDVIFSVKLKGKGKVTYLTSVLPSVAPFTPLPLSKLRFTDI